MDLPALPALPLLRGKENLDEWSNLVIQHCRAHGILDFLTNDPREAALRNTRMKAFAVVLLTTSASPVMDRLTHGGWKLKAVDQDPTVLWNLIQKVIPGPTIAEIEVPQLRSQFATLDVQPNQSPAAFISRAVDMRRRLAEFHADFDDEEATKTVLDATARAASHSYLGWRRSAAHLFSPDTTTWDKLMEYLGKFCF
jgi:hypothetical protein